jgi:hypothetical protein
MIPNCIYERKNHLQRLSIIKLKLLNPNITFDASLITTIK